MPTFKQKTIKINKWKVVKNDKSKKNTNKTSAYSIHDIIEVHRPP